MLSSNVKLQIRGGRNFGYYVAAGVHVYAGALIALNANQNIVRVGDSGAVAFAGIADRELDNSASSSVSTDYVVAQRDLEIKITVPSATPANIGATVYGVDDGTVTLTQSGSLLSVGMFNGFDNGTWLKVVS